MRRTIQLLLALVAVTTAFHLGRSTRPSNQGQTPRPDPVWADFQAPSLVTSYGGGNTRVRTPPDRYELVPYRMLVDGNRVFDNLDGKEKTGDIWQINLANNRIVIMAVRRIPIEQEDRP